MSAIHPSRSPRSPDPFGRRDAGLHHVRAMTRWTIVGSAAAALVLGLGYAHALPDLAALLPAHGSGGGGGGGFTEHPGAGSGGVQAPGLPGGQGGSHTTTGSS
ncbi:hypothetical protein [Streptacidiphilus jiangxiensis]|uniref:Uncharacterized protein n=1 Tax=Streptacidiphilus jiangxiensis TaxID=235985 RepID=A0A1H7QQ32_STRJI|nr:hypothetical protein [Streptacidiphilus jiangxiensis]SEL50086.1 hypothetical protein SAMN05414137_109154 [Streptacidiphilus jiangxiensis]